MTTTKNTQNGGVCVSDLQLGSKCDEETVILGLDGGTTSTICVCMPLFPISNHHHLPDPLPVLGRAIAGCSNHNSVGESLARETLEKVMMEALSKSGAKKSAVKAVCLGVSGVNHPKDQERILNWLRDIFPRHVKLYVQNDAVAALASGSMGKLHGCVLIAGTGCIAYGFAENGKEARAAGGGPILGDWGSGYGIAAKALTAVVRAHDGRGPQTMLTDYILKSLNLSSPDELIGWTYADPSWARIAALVPEVVSCAEAGDGVANEILNYAVAELALAVKAVVQRLGLSGEGAAFYPRVISSTKLSQGVLQVQGKTPKKIKLKNTLGAFHLDDGRGQFPVVLVGGVLTSNKNWDIGQKVVDCLIKTYPGAFPVRPKVEPAVGAALLACNFLMKEKERNGVNI